MATGPHDTDMIIANSSLRGGWASVYVPASGLEVPTLELVGHQEHGQVLVDAAQAAAVDLDELEGRGLEELLEHHPVVTLDDEIKC